MLLVSPSDGVHFLSKGTAVAAAVAEQRCDVDEDDDETIEIEDDFEDDDDDDEDDREIRVVEKRKTSIRRVMGGEGREFSISSVSNTNMSSDTEMH